MEGFAVRGCDLVGLLIVFGMTLLLANVSQGRFAEIKRQLRVWKEKRAFRPQGH